MKNKNFALTVHKKNSLRAYLIVLLSLLTLSIFLWANPAVSATDNNQNTAQENGYDVEYTISYDGVPQRISTQAEAASVQTDNRICPETRPVQCDVNGHPSCVRRQTLCDAPVGWDRCPGNGALVPAGKAGDLCPARYEPRCPIYAPYRCPDSFCRKNADHCSAPLGCPVGQDLCFDGSCVPVEDSCPAAPACASGDNYCPADGSCVTPPTECPDYPYKFHTLGPAYMEKVGEPLTPGLVRCASGDEVAEAKNCPTPKTSNHPGEIACPSGDGGDLYVNHVGECNPVGDSRHLRVVTMNAVPDLKCEVGQALCENNVCSYQCVISSPATVDDTVYPLDIDITHAVATGGNYTFDFPGHQVPLTVTDDGGCLTAITIEALYENHPFATVPLETGIYWNLTATGCTTGFSVDLTLPYTGVDDSDKICRYTGSDWECAMSSIDTVAGTITRNGIREFSDWTIGDNAGPTAVSLQSITANSNAAIIPILIATLLLALVGGVALRRRSG